MTTNGKHCPACGRDIGLWAVFSAGLPNRIRCPHCAAWLSYRGTLDVLLAVLLAMAAALSVAWLASALVAESGRTAQLAVFAAVLLGTWTLVELVVVRYLRSNRTLVQRDSRSHSTRDDVSSGATADH